MTKKHGFTILELTITVGMMTILIGAIMSVYLTCFRAYNSGADRSKVRTQLSQAIDQMTKDLQKAQYITVCTSTASSTATLTFYANLGSGANTYSYSYSNTTEQLTGPFGTVKAVDIVPQGTVVNWGTTPALFSCGNGVVTIDMTAVGNAKTISSTVRGDTVHIQTYVRTRNIPVGLVGWWQFDEGTVGQNVTTAQDSSGNGFTATFQNTPTWVAGHTGNAISLNGSNQCGTVSSSLSVQSINKVTITGWIYPNSFSSYNAMVYTNNTNGGYWLQTLVSGDVGAGRIRFGAGGVYFNSNAAIPLYVWTHIAGTFDGSNFNIYINGVLDNTMSESATINDSGVLKIIGSSNSSCNSQVVDGYLDDVRIYNRALSASEIAQVYNGE